MTIKASPFDQSPLAGEAYFPPPRSVYLHVPFCARRCGYCNFTVVAGRDDLIESYLEAIEREIAWQRVPVEVDTLFFGGGTPTQLPMPALRRLLQLTGETFLPALNYEWSIEANPADLAEEKVHLLAEGGVTRISLGAQSFNDQHLETLERDHRREDILRAMELAKKRVGQVNLDLIFAIPGQSLSDWEEDLKLAIQYEPDHISTYGLTFEKGAPFWARRAHGALVEIDDDIQRAMYELAIELLTTAGYEHYEVSNYAKPKQRCRHNEKCWLGEEYFGIGPGAASYIHGRRATNHRSTTTWMKQVMAGQSPVAEFEDLSAEEAMREQLVFGLRRMEGVDLVHLASNTGVNLLPLVGPILDRYIAGGWLVRKGDRVKLTRQGLFLSDSLWPDLLGE